MASKVLLVANSAEDLRLSRLSLVRALVARGYRVAAAMPNSATEEERNAIRSEGIEIFTYPFQPTGMNLFLELRSLAALRQVYRQFEPDVVHHLKLKPALLGGIVARHLAIGVRIQSIMGLGFLFVSSRPMIGLLRTMLAPAFRTALGGPGSALTLQNPDDLGALRKIRFVAPGQWPRVEILPGSGVDLEGYDPGATPEEPPIVLFAGRLKTSKGIAEFVEAARIINCDRPAVRFVLCGATVENPDAVSESRVREWVQSGVVEWWGYRSDMPRVFGRTSIVVLPSHGGEGIPRTLIEAAAAGRPIVTTDAPGCREIVRHGVNGLLVPVRDAAALAEAILSLVDAPRERVRMGQEGRRRVETEFSLEIVLRKTLSLYDELLDDRKGALSI